MPKTPQFLTPRGTPKYKRQDSLVQDDFMKSDDFTEAYSHLDENAFQSYQQSFTASDVRGPSIQRDSAPPKYGDQHAEVPNDSRHESNPAFDMTPPQIARYMDPPNMQREVYTFGVANGKAPLATPVNNDKHQKRNTIWLIILTVLVLLLIIMSSISLYRTADQQSKIDNLESGTLVEATSRNGEGPELVTGSTTTSEDSYTLASSIKALGETDLKVIGSLTAGQGYWIEKKEMPDPRSDFQAIYVTQEKQNQISEEQEGGADLTGQVLIIGGHDDRGSHLKNVIVYDPVLEQYDTLVEDMPQERAKFAAVLYRGHIVVIGGYENEEKENANEPEGGMFLYDLNLGGWLSENDTKMKTPRSDLCAAVVDDVIYVAGGAGPGREPINTIEAFDWDKSEWREVGYMPTARADLHCAEVHGKLYIAGGNDGGQFSERFTDELLEFDPKTGKVAVKASLNYPRADAQLVALKNGHLLLMGGEVHYADLRAQIAVNYVEEWIPEEDIWVVRPPLAKGRFRFGAALIDDGIWVFGGHPTCVTPFAASCYPEARQSVEAFYDTPHPNVFLLAPPDIENADTSVLNVDDSVQFKEDPMPENGFVMAGSLNEGSGYWIPKKSTMESPLSDFGLEPLTLDSFLFFGGVQSEGGEAVASDKVYLGNTILEKYETKTAMPETRLRFAHTKVGDRVFVIGGIQTPEGGPQGSVMQYKSTEDKWDILDAELNTPRVDACAASVDGVIYVFGGWDSDYEHVGTVEMFTPGKSTEWEVLDTVMPTPRGDARCVNYQDEIYVVGGFNNARGWEDVTQHSSQVEVFNPDSQKWHSVAPLPVASGDSVVVALPSGQGIMVVGGETYGISGDTKKTEIALHNVFQWLPRFDTWVERAPLPMGRFRAAGMFIDNSVQVLGGNKSCDTYDESGKDHCHLHAVDTHIAFYDLDTPDIFVFTKKE